VTFKGLKKKVNLEGTREQKAPERLGNKLFLIWDAEQHKQEDIDTKGYCCFNHVISLPTKWGLWKGMFDYEKLLYYSLLDNDCSNTLKQAYF
jgi:hypothetical protein